MILSLFRRNTATEPVFAIYRSIVAQSRQPVFYADWGVPDTVTGRFDMISLHLALLFRRLRHDGKDSKNFAQAVFDLFFKDMDRQLREMGVTDIGVPKKIQKMGNLFFGLLASLNEAMDKNDVDGVESVLARNIYDGESSGSSRRLAEYLLAQSDSLDAQQVAIIVGGTIVLDLAA